MLRPLQARKDQTVLTLFFLRLHLLVVGVGALMQTQTGLLVALEVEGPGLDRGRLLVEQVTPHR